MDIQRTNDSNKHKTVFPGRPSPHRQSEAPPTFNMAPQTVQYRQSYVEKDRCVRNSISVQVPGVDVLHGLTLSKSEFKHVFLQAAENMDDPSRISNPANATPVQSAPPAPAPVSSRFGCTRKTPVSHPPEPSSLSSPHRAVTPPPNQSSSHPFSQTQAQAQDPLTAAHAFRAPPSKFPEPVISSPEDAAVYADVFSKHAASLQRSTPLDYDGARNFLKKHVTHVRSTDCFPLLNMQMHRVNTPKI